MNGIFRALLVTLSLTILSSMAASGFADASVQDFTVPTFTADYYLSRDGSHSSHLRIHEHLVARFPETDQNHGILRVIPDEYRMRNLNVQVQSVTDESGKNLPYSKSSENHNIVLKIGEPNRYVHGIQTYNINYSEDNITSNEPNVDTYNWDTNGEQWQQQFGQVTAHVHLPSDLAPQLMASLTRCFTGPHGSSAQDCTTSTDTVGDGTTTTTFTATRALEAGETLTFNMSFTPGTFAGYHIPADQLWRLVALIILGYIIPVLLTLGIVIGRWRKYGRDPKGKGTIIAQYTPPKDLSVLASNAVLQEKFQPKAISAQIIDLAVRHYLKIYEIKHQKILNDVVSYEVELIKDPAGLRPEEQTVLTMLFGLNPVILQRADLTGLKNKLYKAAAELGENVNQKLVVDGFFRSNPARAKLPYFIAGGALLAVSLLGIPYTLGFSIAGIILLISANYMPARTQAGVDSRDYLLGLKHYMEMAEADRLKELQSPRGGLTEKVDISSDTQLVKLYERLLPYAMLLGIEKDWAGEFAELYENAPDWYAGASSFNAAYFAGSITNFGSQSVASFSAPSSSSSGGGFSGGGGGGGGGGGW